MWTSQAAMELQVPIPTSDLTVAMRDMSAFANGRAQAEALLRRDRRRLSEGRDTFLARLSHAFYAAMIITDAQGMALLSVAPEKYNYHLVSKPWRGSGEAVALFAPPCSKRFGPRFEADVTCRICCSTRSGRQGYRTSGRFASSHLPGGGIRAAGSGPDGFFGLPRRLSQRLAAGQSHPGSARLFRSSYL